jgi:hypothetical protein
MVRFPYLLYVSLEGDMKYHQIINLISYWIGSVLNLGAHPREFHIWGPNKWKTWAWRSFFTAHVPWLSSYVSFEGPYSKTCLAGSFKCFAPLKIWVRPLAQSSSQTWLKNVENTKYCAWNILKSPSCCACHDPPWGSHRGSQCLVMVSPWTGAATTKLHPLPAGAALTISTIS